MDYIPFLVMRKVPFARMPSDWSFGSIPELEGLPPEERKRLWQEAYKRAHKRWQVWLSFLPMVGLLALASLVDGIIAFAIAGAIGGAIYGMVLVRYTRPILREMRGKTHDEVTPPPRIDDAEP